MISRLAFYPTLLYNVVIERLGLVDWYTRIDDTVILGALPFLSTAKKLVKEEAVKGVVTLNEEFETKLFTPDQKVWQSLGVTQLRLSTPDLVAPPTQEHLRQGVDFILTHRHQGACVYVHCKAGRTRSATLVAAYLIQVHRWPPLVAVAYIKQKRSHVWLRPKQIKALERYYENSQPGSL